MIRVPLRTARGSWKIHSDLSSIKVKLISNIKMLFLLNLKVLAKVILALEGFLEIFYMHARALLVIVERFNFTN